MRYRKQEFLFPGEPANKANKETPQKIIIQLPKQITHKYFPDNNYKLTLSITFDGTCCSTPGSSRTENLDVAGGPALCIVCHMQEFTSLRREKYQFERYQSL